MTKKNATKTFDISTIKGINAAEKYQSRLYKKYDIVKVITIGIDKITIGGA